MAVNVFVLTFTDDTGSWGTVVAGAGASLDEVQEVVAVDFAECNLSGPDGIGDWSEDENDWGTIWTARFGDPKGQRSGVFEVCMVSVVGEIQED